MTENISEKAAQKDSIMRALAHTVAQARRFQDDEPDSQESLIEAARALITAAESPVESLLWNFWAQPTRIVAARVAVDLQLFQTTVQHDSRPKTAVELAAPTKAAPDLVERIARVCVSMGLLDEEGPGLYKPNHFTHALARPEYSRGIIFCFDGTQQTFARFPEYLRGAKFQPPRDPCNGPFQLAHQWNGHPFEYLAQRPELFQSFHDFMNIFRTDCPSWFEMYPAKQRLIEGMNVEGSTPAFVDIGGSTCQLLGDFSVHFPEYTGRLVLQDLPEVIEAARLQGVDPHISLQAHDFFTPQPVKGARAYFLGWILHNWPDDKCRTILGHLRDAMNPGYSKVLISDYVVSEEKAAWKHVSLDIFMMAMAAAHERTEHQWRELIESCGLRVSGIYSKGSGNESVIEVTI
ncbi:S-adenosyl-L-methionine-dependent methyltransferase [Xylaria palmicola]|nr:S-adenosyl-L-methionine-dependent methyltransferase [Xylaria palmicola]